MTTPQLNAIIANSLVISQRSVQMKPSDRTAFFVEKTPMTHLTALKKCVLNAIKLAIKQKNAKRKI